MTTFIGELLRNLCAAPGTSGWEESAAAVVCSQLQTVAPSAKIHQDAMGNVTAFLGDPTASRQILLDAHLDQIGLVVTHITEEGFLKIAPVGGMDRRVLPSSAVTVYGKEPIHGIIGFLPPHLTKDDGSKYPEFDALSIDIGCEKEEAESLVSLGDRAIVDGPFHALLGTRVTAAALDDRAGCAALIACAKELQDRVLNCGVTLSFTSREETGCEGAKTAAYRIDPTEAIIVDVSFGDQPGVSEQKTGKLGGGAMIGIAPSLNRKMKETLIQLCKENDLSYQLEVMGGSTGTNADNIGTTKEGVKTAMLSIPLRYMHTPTEVVDLKDIANVAKLLTYYVTGGEPQWQI